MRIWRFKIYCLTLQIEISMANKKKSSGDKISRAKATTPKAGVTANRGRRYSGGGKLKGKC